MRRNLLLALTAVVALAFVAQAADEPWFDMEKCGFCKTIAAQPGLLDHMKTEYHNTQNGIISVTYLDKAYEPAFAKAQENMKPVIADVMAGKPVEICKHCSTIGGFYQMGIMPDTIKSEKCIIVVYSSPDADKVAKLQDFAKKSNAALAEIYKKKESAPAKK
jgi:hypothetical protein